MKAPAPAGSRRCHSTAGNVFHDPLFYSMACIIAFGAWHGPQPAGRAGALQPLLQCERELRHEVAGDRFGDRRSLPLCRLDP